MHPFGGTQYCPRCSKPVYAAEQVLGPGRKLYHKPCLACMSCNKRLDSYTLLEHDQMPYCKSCHIKNFANRDLRQANLPHYEVTSSTSSPSSSPARGLRTGNSSTDDISTPHIRPRSTSPISSSFTNLEALPSTEVEDKLQHITDESSVVLSYVSRLPPQSIIPTNTGRPGLGGIPRTVPLTPTHGDSPSQSRHHFTKSVDSIRASPMSQNQAEGMRPLAQVSSGTRYGVALGGGSPSKWGAGTPSCPRCGKSVYFAEQVKAVGKTFHKGCLRCTECNTLLDSSRLRDHNGDPICVRCYGKLHGPQGAGYALLGKAGG